MNPLLTKEANETVERIRKKLNKPANFISADSDLVTLFAILDSIKPPEPKQYTEEELRSKFEELGGQPYQPNAMFWFLTCARSLGALKEDKDKT